MILAVLRDSRNTQQEHGILPVVGVRPRRGTSSYPGPGIPWDGSLGEASLENRGADWVRITTVSSAAATCVSSISSMAWWPPDAGTSCGCGTTGAPCGCPPDVPLPLAGKAAKARCRICWTAPDARSSIQVWVRRPASTDAAMLNRAASASRTDGPGTDSPLMTCAATPSATAEGPEAQAA